MVTVKLDRGGLNNVGILPEARISAIKSDARTAVGRHGAGSHVNGVGGSQKGAVGLRLQVAVSAFDLVVGGGVPGRPIHTHGPAGSGHASVDNPGRASQHEHLVGGSVGGAVSPGFAVAVR